MGLESQPTPAVSQRQLVVLVMAEAEFGVDIRHVREVIRVTEIIRMPRTPQFIEGIINLRGRILPVLDLKKRFQLPAAERTDQTRIMVVEWRGQFVGFLVDRVNEVVRVPSASVSAPPEMILNIAGHYLEGIVEVQGRLLILLDMERILDQEEIQGLADLELRSVSEEAAEADHAG